MSTRVELLVGMAERHAAEETSRFSKSVTTPAGWNVERFGTEQLLGLVQQIFLAEKPEGCRHVVFSAVDAGTEIGNLCLHVGGILAEQSGKRVCVADATEGRHDGDEVFGRKANEPILDYGLSGTLRDSSRQLSDGLWFVPSELFWDQHKEVSFADVLGRRLHQLHVEFDFCVIQAPAATTSGTAGMLGRSSDGLVLVLEANSTRRWAAQRAWAILQAAHAKLLGTVLIERTFPVPEKLYWRL